jgi:hypothetical protein
MTDLKQGLSLYCGCLLKKIRMWVCCVIFKQIIDTWQMAWEYVVQALKRIMYVG